MGTGQKYSVSNLLMVQSSRLCWGAQCSQTDGAVPDASLDDLFKFKENNISSLIQCLAFFLDTVLQVCEYISLLRKMSMIRRFMHDFNSPDD